MWYYYINIVFRVLNTNNYSKVWCDVLIRYILNHVLWESNNYYSIADIYNIIHWERLNDAIIKRKLYPSRLESKYRYSGLLYDKLRCLLSYVHYNYLGNVIDDFDTNKYLIVIKSRFDTQNMNLQYGERHTMYYNDSLLKNLYFIDN